jgi:hypothetical protein
MDGTGRRRCADIVNAGSTTARLIAAKRVILAGYRWQISWIEFREIKIRKPILFNP